MRVAFLRSGDHTVYLCADGARVRERGLGCGTTILLVPSRLARRVDES